MKTATMLTAADLEQLHKLRIPDELLEEAGIRRVTNREARDDYGFHFRGDLDGILYPYITPTGERVNARIRRDRPDMKEGKETAKYVSADRDHRRFYYPPGCVGVMADTSRPIVFVEAEKSVLAIEALVRRTETRITAMGLGGCHSYNARIGKTTNASGDRVDEVGLLKDFDMFTWIHRKVILCFDSNVSSNAEVQRAERELRRQLIRRGAVVHCARIPEEPGCNGPDDYIAKHTDAEFLRILDNAGTVDPRDVMRFTRLGDLLSEHEEETAWLMADHLPMSGDSLLVAKPKVGKSTLARGLALAVARGEDFLGCHTAQGSVFYLALEEKRAEVRRHFRAMGARKEDPIFVFCASSPADGLEQLREAMKDEKPVLVIVDPLLRFVRVKDGNDYAAVTNALEPLHNLARESGGHVLAVHHVGKGDRQGGDAVLGSTALFAAVDTLLIMKRNDKYRTLSSIQRYGTDLEEITLEYDPDTRTLSAGVAREEADLVEAGKLILEYLCTQSDPVEENDIHEAVEARRATKQKALRKLVVDGKVSRTGTGKKGDRYRYGDAAKMGEKDSGTEVPNIYRVPEYLNSENGLTNSPKSANAGTGLFEGTEQSEESQVPESEDRL